MTVIRRPGRHPWNSHLHRLVSCANSSRMKGADKQWIFYAPIAGPGCGTVHIPLHSPLCWVSERRSSVVTFARPDAISPSCHEHDSPWCSARFLDRTASSRLSTSLNATRRRADLYSHSHSHSLAFEAELAVHVRFGFINRPSILVSRCLKTTCFPKLRLQD